MSAHCAAWPRERAFIVRARQAPHWAIEQIAERIEAGDSARALDWAQHLLLFWRRAVAMAGDAALFEASLSVAAGLADERTAAELVEPFSQGQLTPEMAPCLLQLLERHGSTWCGERLRRWAVPYLVPEVGLAWIARALPVLTEALQSSGNIDGPALAATLMKERWACFAAVATLATRIFGKRSWVRCCRPICRSAAVNTSVMARYRAALSAVT